MGPPEIAPELITAWMLEKSRLAELKARSARVRQDNEAVEPETPKPPLKLSGGGETRQATDANPIRCPGSRIAFDESSRKLCLHFGYERLCPGPIPKRTHLNRVERNVGCRR